MARSVYWPLHVLFTSFGNGNVVKGIPRGSAPVWQPPSGTLMTNDINDNKLVEEVMTMFMPRPPAATYLAFHPQDNNIIVTGMEDSTIQIYNIRVDEVKTKLKGHQNQITGLPFSQTLNALVSSGADAQLCMWSTDKWEKLKSRFIQAPAGHQSPLVGETKVQFHNDQTHLLVVHDSQISIYDSKLECSRSCVAYRSELIVGRFIDGAAYISNTPTYPFVIAAHPSEPNQIALGMSDRAVHVVEPLDVKLKWGGTPSQDNGSPPSSCQILP
ncbi:hypothetical protein Patl1_24450 [Pistacia atlantica]|uniref:Uncharacterized protein n=1 Tax=Pistacia atlantica TaxID=434234 RepID=A0ACC1A2U7_9ROSI|nr:hypothetical protein Patl1_24450 [Pistacia atlantica]